MFTMVLAGLPVSGAWAATDMATVITRGAPPVDCVAAVEITKIDGQYKVVPAGGFDIEPGDHRLNGSALIDTTWCKFSKNGNMAGPVADLQVNFQAGRTYYIGFDHKSDNNREWKLVVWKVE